MESNWRLLKIGDVGEVVGGGTPSTKNEDYYGGEISWITPKDLSGYNKKYISKGARSITKQGLENSSAKLLPQNTVLLSSRAPIGYVAIASNPMTTNQGFKSVICNEDLIIPDYLYYVLKSSKEKLEAVASGSTFKEVSGKVVKEFEILIPNILNQRKIINILNGIDEKFEINLDIISSLEELSQILFKRWFIDFEFPNEDRLPYKSSGGKMVDSELGEIPEGWEIKSLGDISSYQNGYAFYKIGYDNSDTENTYDVFDLGNIDINANLKITGNEKKISKERITENLTKFILKYHDLVTIMTDRTQDMGILGKTALIDEDEKYLLNQRVYRLRIEDKNLRTYILRVLNSESVSQHFKTVALGSAQKYINTNHINDLEILIPKNRLLMEFNNLIFPIIMQKEEINKQNKKLTELRDSLLPKLLSGEIEIPEESVVE